jgi:predicted acetyltransferase
MVMKHKQNVRLLRPSLELQSEFMDMVHDFVTAGEGEKEFECQHALKDTAKYINDCHNWEKGKNLPDGWVSESAFWLIRDDNVILGTSYLRHTLNDKLRIFGGNIGYKIRPGQRRKGYGTAILKLTITKAKLFGLKRVLITCDDDNIASAKIIEKNGGILKDKCYREPLGSKLTRRYWIELD